MTKINSIYAEKLTKLFKNNDINELLDLIKKPDAANIEIKRGNNLLHLACYYGCIDLIKPLIEIGIDINSENEEKETPLFRAIYQNHFNVVKLLVENGADVFSKDIFNNSALHVTCYIEENPVNIMQFLLDQNIDIDSVNNDGNTPLHDACKFNKIESGMFLIIHNANINAINNYDENPLDIAIAENNTDIVNAINTYKEYKNLYNDLNQEFNKSINFLNKSSIQYSKPKL